MADKIGGYLVHSAKASDKGKFEYVLVGLTQEQAQEIGRIDNEHKIQQNPLKDDLARIDRRQDLSPFEKENERNLILVQINKVEMMRRGEICGLFEPFGPDGKPREGTTIYVGRPGLQKAQVIRPDYLEDLLDSKNLARIEPAPRKMIER